MCCASERQDPTSASIRLVVDLQPCTEAAVFTVRVCNHALRPQCLLCVFAQGLASKSVHVLAANCSVGMFAHPCLQDCVGLCGV